MDENNILLFFSQERLSSYQSVEEHFDNLRLIAKITPKLASIELILRNLLDSKKRQIDADWLRNCTNIDISSKIRKPETNGAPNHTQLLSRLSLGEIIGIIGESNRMRSEIFSLQHLDFRHYDASNKNFCMDVANKPKFTNADKATIVMKLIHSIRNRCFHWENLLKTRINKGRVYPRITTNFRGTIIGVAPQNIEKFLGDILNSFDEGLLRLIDGSCGNEDP